MRFVYFGILSLFVVNILMYLFCVLTGENIYKKYGTRLLKCLYFTVFLAIVAYITCIFISIVS